MEKKLIEVLAALPYDTYIGVYIDKSACACACATTSARMGDRRLEQGGVLDALQFLCTSEFAIDFLDDYTGRADTAWDDELITELLIAVARDCADY